MSNIVNCTRNPAEVEFLKIEELIQLCLKIEVGERAGSASELLENAALSSLAAQLKNGISPNELLFGKNRVETIEMISEKVNRENKQMKDKNSELADENSGLKHEIEKLNHEIAELKKLSQFLIFLRFVWKLLKVSWFSKSIMVFKKAEMFFFGSAAL